MICPAAPTALELLAENKEATKTAENGAKSLQDPLMNML
jgi:hypothetical protein